MTLRGASAGRGRHRFRPPNIPMRGEVAVTFLPLNPVRQAPAGKKKPDLKTVLEARWRFANLDAALDQGERIALQKVMNAWTERVLATWPVDTGTSRRGLKLTLGLKHGDEEPRYVRSATFALWSRPTVYTRAVEAGAYFQRGGRAVKRLPGKYIRKAWQSTWRAFRPTFPAEVIKQTEEILRKEGAKRLR